VHENRIKIDHSIVGRENDNHINFVVSLNDNEKLKQYTQFIFPKCYIFGIPFEWFILKIGVLILDLRAYIVLKDKIAFLLQVHKWNARGHEELPFVDVNDKYLLLVLNIKIISLMKKY